MGSPPVMRLDTALAGVSTLGIDTSPFIYYIERHTDHVAVMREVVRRVDEGIIMAATSAITLTEVLTRPKQVGDSRLEAEYRALLIRSRNLQSVTHRRGRSRRSGHTPRSPWASHSETRSSWRRPRSMVARRS